MNVVNGDRFTKRQPFTNQKKRFQPPPSRLGTVNTSMSIEGNMDVAGISNAAAKPPRYAFDGLVSGSGVQNGSSRLEGNTMGPPQQSNRINRKRAYTSSASAYADAISSSGKTNASSNTTAFSTGVTKDAATPKYVQNARPVSSSTSRGHARGSRTTPGSSTSNNTMPDSCIILAISEGRGTARGEVGMAAIDLRRPHLVLCQLSDSHSYIHSLTKIHYFHPIEIIVPHTFNSGVVSTELYRLIQNQFPSIRLTSVQRRHFSDSAGLQRIQQLCAPEYNSVELQLMHKFYALTSAAAVLKYVEYIQCVVFAPHSLKIDFNASQNSTLIDVETAVRLELVESLSGTADRGSCLLSILNHTYTAGGLRNLRANILQPTCDPKVINARLDCIEELLENNEGLLPALQSVMKQLYDVDKILWLCMLFPNQDGSKAGEAQLNHTLQLKTTTDLVPNLITALGMAKGQWFADAKQALENPKFSEISERIKRVLQDNAQAGRGATAYHQRCFAVRAEINGLLDVARRSYCEIITDIQEKAGQLADTYSLPLRLLTNASRGFHLVLSLGVRNRSGFNIANLPPIFLEVQNHGSSISMTTEELILLDQQARESLIEIQNMSNIVIYGLLTELRPYIGVLYKLCEIVAELDVILSLTQVSSAGNYIRPLFNDYLELKDSIHPMLDYVIPKSPICNDVFSSPEFNFHIITGPNMGGKTIFIKQIALLQIMAQVGCFVPATRAVFRITDHVFSRIGFNDSIECNASTYVLEMKEIHYILKTITPTSLIIIDELCRGTSSEEGTSMAWAICEQLLNTKAFTFFTTHFLYLTKLQDLYYNVVNLHTKAEEIESATCGGDKQLVYKHKIEPGVTTIEQYGLTLAKKTNIPRSVINLAEDLSKIIIRQRKPRVVVEFQETQDFILYKLAAELMHKSRHPEATNEMLNDIIKQFKEKHPEIIENISLKRSQNSGEISNGIHTSPNIDSSQHNRRSSTPLEKATGKLVLDETASSVSSSIRKTQVELNEEKKTMYTKYKEESTNVNSISDFDDNRFLTKRIPDVVNQVGGISNFNYGRRNTSSSVGNCSEDEHGSESYFNFNPRMGSAYISNKNMNIENINNDCQQNEDNNTETDKVNYHEPPVVALKQNETEEYQSQSSVTKKLTMLFGEVEEEAGHVGVKQTNTEELLNQLNGDQTYNSPDVTQKIDFNMKSDSDKSDSNISIAAISESELDQHETFISTFDDDEESFDYDQFINMLTGN